MIKKMLKWNILASTIATPPRDVRHGRKKSIPTNTFSQLSLDFSKVFFSFFSIVEYFFLFHFCFYYSGRYKSNTSPLCQGTPDNWYLSRRGGFIHTISFLKGYFTMYERLCVYINMEQNSWANERAEKRTRSLPSVWHGYFTCLFFVVAAISHQKN